jgi:hypothetical protein
MELAQCGICNYIREAACPEGSALIVPKHSGRLAVTLRKLMPILDIVGAK